MITAHFMYDEGADCLALASLLTDLQAEHPDHRFRFCTHDTELAIGILEYTANDPLTHQAIADAWHRQSSYWIHSEDADFNLEAWIAGWALLAPSAKPADAEVAER